jgi:hypothetical protein
MSKTREQYEASVEVLQAKPWGKLVEERYDARPGRARPYMLASFDRSCAYEDAELVGAAMARLAAEHRGYLTCHTGAGCMEFSINISRDIDEQDEPAPQAEAAS